MPRHITKTSQETKKLAKILASEAVGTKKSKKALVLALVGDLGSGKTTFIQGFMKGLGIKRRITSPSFLIFRSYKLPSISFKFPAEGEARHRRRVSGFKKVYHIDCYRLKKPNELLVLGFKEILADPKNLILIEWADKIKKILPKDTIWLEFKHGKLPNQRIIKIKLL